MSLRVAFMGTPDFAIPTLQALLDAQFDVMAVYTQPPRPAGRGKSLRPSPVHAFADQHGIEVRTPKSLRNEDAAADFAALNLDIAVVVAYGLILPKAILNAPRLGCVNVHASLLPRWRGAAPIHRAIMAGDSETGVTIMQMDEGLDTGDMLLVSRTDIAPDDTTKSLHDRLATLGAKVIAPAIEGLMDGSIKPTPQPDAGVTYAEKIDKTEARIDWTAPAQEIDRKVRGLFPFPGAWFEYEGERIKILAGQIVPQAGLAGMALDDRLTIACGGAAYRIRRAQRAGKAAMDADELLRGFSLPAGSHLA